VRRWDLEGHDAPTRTCSAKTESEDCRRTGATYMLRWPEEPMAYASSPVRAKAASGVITPEHPDIQDAHDDRCSRTSLPYEHSYNGSLLRWRTQMLLQIFMAIV
jgi:hypothetical protein